MAQIRLKRKKESIANKTLIAGDIAIAKDRLYYGSAVDGIEATTGTPIEVAATNLENNFTERNNFGSMLIKHKNDLGPSLIIQDSSGTAFYEADAGRLKTSKTFSFNESDLVNRKYVDERIQGLNIKEAVLVATTENIILTGFKTVDTVTVVENNRVLVKNQTNPKENGIYTVKTGAWVRADDANTSSEIKNAFVFVDKGYANNTTGWVMTTDGAIVLETTDILWAQFSGAGSYTGTSPIKINGSVISLGTFGGDSHLIDATVGNAKLANSKITIGSTGINLGGTATTIEGLTLLKSAAIETNGVTTPLIKLGTTESAVGNIFNDKTASGKTKTINIGTEGLSGSATNINIGSNANGEVSIKGTLTEISSNIGGAKIVVDGDATISFDGEGWFKDHATFRGGLRADVRVILTKNTTEPLATSIPEGSIWYYDDKIFAKVASGTYDLTNDTTYGVVADGSLELSSGLFNVKDLGITTAKIVNKAITAAKIADKTITAAQIADKTITAAKIADKTVSVDKIADGAITTIKVADGAITGVKLGTAAVTTGAIADAAVTNAKLSNMATGTIKGRLAATDGAPQDISYADLKTALGLGSAAYSSVTAYRSANWTPLWTDMPTTVPTWNQNTTGKASTAGNADTATKLKNKRKINGIEFDGTADITISTANLSDNILEATNVGTQITYAPYTTDVSAHASPRFYTHSALPNSAASLKFNGSLALKNLFAVGDLKSKTISFANDNLEGSIGLYAGNAVTNRGKSMVFSVSDSVVSELSELGVFYATEFDGLIDGGTWI